MMTKDSQNETDHPERTIKTSLEEFETCLETPIIAGELVNWVGEVQNCWAALSAQIHEHVATLHPRQYQQISKEDPALLSQIEKLKTEDEALDEDRQEFERTFHRFAEQAPKFEPDEERIAEIVKSLIEQGISLVTRARTQEVALQTWFVEAFTRDRGVAD